MRCYGLSARAFGFQCIPSNPPSSEYKVSGYAIDASRVRPGRNCASRVYDNPSGPASIACSDWGGPPTARMLPGASRVGYQRVDAYKSKLELVSCSPVYLNTFLLVATEQICRPPASMPVRYSSYVTRVWSTSSPKTSSLWTALQNRMFIAAYVLSNCSKRLYTRVHRQSLASMDVKAPRAASTRTKDIAHSEAAVERYIAINGLQSR
jgi:hypothetical protein